MDFKSNNILIFFDEIQDCHKARLSFKNFKIDGRYNVIGSGSYLVINGYVIGDTTPAPTGYEDVMQMKTIDFEALVFDSLNKAGIEPFYFSKESGLKIDFVISYNGYATLIEAKTKTGNTESSKTVMKHPEHYGKTKLIKIGDYNISEEGDIITIPHYLTFVLGKIKYDF